MMQSISLEDIAQRIEQIPTIPVVSTRINSLLQDEEVSITRVAGLIEKDQSLATKILKVANSAFYGTLNKVSSIDHALVVLGLEEVKGILMAFAVYNFFQNDKNGGFDRKSFWKHSIICSQVAKYLARYFKVEKDDTLFLSGLIHDMGKVVFDQYFHEEFLKIIDHVSSKHERFSKVEKEIVGITHYQVGAKLLQRWKFPERVIMQVFYHHAPWYDKNFPTGSIIIYLANILTKIAGYPCVPLEKKMDITSMASGKVMDFINKSGFELDEAALDRIVNQIRDFISMESQDVLGFLED
jgi:putative nucleotidyltransferase with HDIG domain